MHNKIFSSLLSLPFTIAFHYEFSYKFEIIVSEQLLITIIMQNKLNKNTPTPTEVTL